MTPTQTVLPSLREVAFFDCVARLFPGQQLARLGRVRFQVVGMHEVAEPLALKLGSGITDDLAQTLIDVAPPPIRPDKPHPTAAFSKTPRYFVSLSPRAVSRRASSCEATLKASPMEAASRNPEAFSVTTSPWPTFIAAAAKRDIDLLRRPPK